MLCAAIAHFGRDGFRAATLRNIAADVGVTFATIHHYYGTKDALFGACVDVAYQQLMQLAAEVAVELASPPNETRVARAVRHGFRAALREGDRSRFMLRLFAFEDRELVARHLPEQRNTLLTNALSLLEGDGDDRLLEQRRVSFVGLTMLATRFAVASSFELEMLGEAAYAPNGAIEDYLVRIAETTIGPSITDIVEVPR